MNTASRLKTCNRSLGCILILILASGIQLEATSGGYVWSVWLHIALGILLTVLSFYHIYLHYRKSNWFVRFAKNRNTLTRVLWWVSLLTFVSGIAATITWCIDNMHSHIGAIHGKLGFLMVIIAVLHAVRHRKQLHVSKYKKS